MTYASAPAAASPYANWLQRVGAYLVDAIAPVVLILIGAIIHVSAVLFLFYLAALVVWGYDRWYLGGSTGQTWGKKALGLKLVSEKTSEPIGPLMAFVRDVCHIVDGVICYIGYLFPLWDAKRQTLADKIMTTVVNTV